MGSTKSSLTFKKFVSFSAFIGTIIVAIALTLQVILSHLGTSVNVINIMRMIGEIIAYVVTIITAYYYVRIKRSPVWMIIYAICATLITALLILR